MLVPIWQQRSAPLLYCCINDVMGNCISHKCTRRSFRNQQTQLAFLILSGLATGTSWLYYYKALKLGDASKVVPVDKLSVVITIFLSALLLKEPFTLKL